MRCVLDNIECEKGSEKYVSPINVTHLKIDVAVFVHVERAENMVAELFGIARREEHFVHVDEFSWRQTAIGTILLWRGYKIEIRITLSLT